MVVAAAAEKADLLAGRTLLAGQLASMCAVSSISVSAGGMSSGRFSRSSAGIGANSSSIDASADRFEHRSLIFGSVGNVRHAVNAMWNRIRKIVDHR